MRTETVELIRSAKAGEVLAKKYTVTDGTKSNSDTTEKREKFLLIFYLFSSFIDFTVLPPTLRRGEIIP